MKEYKFDKEATKRLIKIYGDNTPNESKVFTLKTYKIAIIAGHFYDDICDKLITCSVETATQFGANRDNIDIYYVPGAFEVPLMAKLLAKSGKYQGIITLGAVIKGETPHFDYVCEEAARGIANTSYEFELPVAFGIITANNKEHAYGRAGGYKGNKAEEATLAMIEMLYLKNAIL